MQDLAYEVRRIPLPRTGVKIALGRLHFHGFGVARQGPWFTRVNRGQQEPGMLCPGPISSSAFLLEAEHERCCRRL
jgi:hypothetical protein